MRSLPSPPSSGPPDLWAVVAPLAAAISVGTVAAILAAIRQINPELRFSYDLWSGLGGLAGGVAGWTVGRGLWRLGRDRPGTLAPATVRRRVIAGLAGLGLAVVGGFLAASTGLPDSRRRDMILGSLMAVAVLGGVGWVLYRLARIFGGPDDEPGPN